MAVLSTALLAAPKQCADKLANRSPLHGLLNQTFPFRFSPGSPWFELRFGYESEAGGWLPLGGDNFSAVVTTVPTAGNPPNVVAIVSSFTPRGSERYHLGWLLRTRHDVVLAEINQRQKLEPGKTKFEILNELSGRWNSSTRGEQMIQIQCEFIVSELQRHHRLKRPTGFWGRWRRSALTMSDAELDRYFEAAPSFQQYPGIGFAMLEKVSSVLLPGAEIEFDVANVITNRVLNRGGTWDRTLLGRYAIKAGFSLEYFINEPLRRNVVLVKKGPPESVYFELSAAD